MTGREGEGGDRVPEDRDETLEDYRKEINEKYDEDEGEKAVSKGGGKKEPEEPGERDDGAEAVSGINRDGEANGRTEDSRQTDSRDLQEARTEGGGDNRGGEDAKPEGERHPERTSGEDELESMREHLGDKYLEDEKEFSRGDGSQPIAKQDNDDVVEFNPSARKTDSDEEKISETKSGNSADEVETSAGNPGTPTENVGASGKEDVGWKIADEPEGQARKSDSIDSNAPTDQEGSRHAEVGDSPAKSTGLEDSPIENTSSVKTIEGADYDGSPQRGESDNPAARTEAKGGGNHLPENEGSMSAKNVTPDAPKEGDHGSRGREAELPMVRKASTYMESLALIIPERVIPEHENRDDVFEVRISRVSKPEEEYEVYMTHKPDYERAYLPIRHVGAEHGEEFQVKKPEKYEESSFARDYNSSKPKGLENTSLEWRDGRFVLKVDNTELALEEAKLRAQEGKAVLDSRLNDEEKNSVKIAKGIDGIDFRLKQDHAVVTSMKESKEGLMMSYERTHHDEFPHVRLMKVENLRQIQGEKVESWEHEARLNPEEVRLERFIERSTDSVKIEFSEANARRAWEYWSSATSQSERFYHQGDIGESVARIALEKSGFKTIPKELHAPHNVRSYAHESEMPGPDVVFYGKVGGKEGYYVGQVKHWRESAKALREAKEDAVKFRSGKDRREVEDKLGGKIMGSFMLELNWSYKDSVGIIYSEYMEY
jgi:hypothetical protein